MTEAQKRWKLNNKEKIRLSSLKYKINCQESFRYNKYKQAAKGRNREFSLTKEEFIIFLKMPCHYCSEITKGGIDRRDNKIGYVLSNCLPCCYECNMFKGSMDYNDFINHCKKIANNIIK